MKKSPLLTCLLLAVLGLLPGCASYYLVQSRFVDGRRALETPEVTETPLYGQVRGAVKVVALRPPDSCEDRGVSQSAGEAELRGDVMRTSCGVEMAEIEKGLAKGGYLVVSWEAIRELSERYVHGDRPGAPDAILMKAPLRAAAELDVDVLLQINSLERSKIVPGVDARWERRFYHSSRAAGVGAPALVKPDRKKAFLRMIAKEEERLSREFLSATIDANAVFVANKASFWFYRWTVADVPDQDPLAEVHVRCDSKACVRQRKRQPAYRDAPVEGSIVAVSAGVEAADADQVVYHGLTRRLVENMVARFAGDR